MLDDTTLRENEETPYRHRTRKKGQIASRTIESDSRPLGQTRLGQTGRRLERMAGKLQWEG